MGTWAGSGVACRVSFVGVRARVLAGIVNGSVGALVTANDDGRIVFWDPSTQEQTDEIRLFDPVERQNRYPGAAIQVTSSADGSAIAATISERGGSASTAVFDVATLEERWRRVTD